MLRITKWKTDASSACFSESQPRHVRLAKIRVSAPTFSGIWCFHGRRTHRFVIINKPFQPLPASPPRNFCETMTTCSPLPDTPSYYHHHKMMRLGGQFPYPSSSTPMQIGGHSENCPVTTFMKLNRPQSRRGRIKIFLYLMGSTPRAVGVW